MKKLIALILIMTSLFTLIQPVSAAEIQSVEPRYTNASNASVYLVISTSGSATIQISYLGTSSLKSAKVTTYFQQKVNGSWKNVDVWSETSTTQTFIKTYSVSVSDSGEYRALTYFILTGSTSETITDTDIKTY